MRNGLDEVVIIRNHLSLLLEGVGGSKVPRPVSVMMPEVFDWDFISEVMKVAAVDNEVVSFPSYC
jgi:hypothetical protein